jgi:16S rRNA (cytosine967-C5)-methyltransferase
LQSTFSISPVKLHKPLIQGIVMALEKIFKEQQYADKVLERIFKQHTQWGSRDRRFVAEMVYDCVRHFRLLSTIAQSEKNFFYMCAVLLCIKKIELPKWPDFKHVNEEDILLHYSQLQAQFNIAESYPDWLSNLCESELGQETWQTEAKALNQQADVILRINTLKVKKERLIELFALDKIEVESIENFPSALRLKKRQNIFTHKLFKEGFFEIQDAGSQRISEFLNAKPGQMVIDACAGGGGKTLHLAALMQNKGKIISLDVEDWKLENLKKRTRRGGVFNVETHLISQKVLQQFSQKADALLLDVPCSGLGVLKRNPDAKWKLSQESIERTKITQQTILNEYESLLKVGGIMVYSTCSILPSENQVQVEEFLASHPNFKLVEQQTLLPSKGFDGFYMARLQKS